MNNQPRQITADRGDAGRRIDLVLHRHLSDVGSATRTRVQAWIEGGLVSVNRRIVRRVSTRAALGDLLAIALPDRAVKTPMRAEQIDLDIVYEDDYLLALNKPAGIVVHPTYGHRDHTMLNALLWHGRNWPSSERPSIVGRLDKFTSGLVVVAKTRSVHAALQRALASDSGEKDYLALVYGHLNVERGTIDMRLCRDPHDRRRVVASAVDGAASRTRFERMAFADAPKVGLSLVRCRLVTGRMHQIRVHLAARGWPIVGDPKYGEPRWPEIDDADLSSIVRAFPRQALHSWRVAVTHPATGEALVVEAPLPEDFRLLLLNTMNIDSVQTHDSGWPARDSDRMRSS